MASGGSSERDSVPLKIQVAERWRQAGERLHGISPELFERVFAVLVLGIPDEDEKNINESSIPS